MSSAARSLFVFGVYAVAAGAGLTLVPGLVLGLLGFPPAQDGWVRVVGALAIFIGIYHMLSARHEFLPYIKATVWARVAFAALLAALVISKQMPPSLLLFAAIDLGGALWTGISLRQARSTVASA